jgi:hypothetical protein
MDLSMKKLGREVMSKSVAFCCGAAVCATVGVMYKLGAGLVKHPHMKTALVFGGITVICAMCAYLFRNEKTA